MTKIVLINKDAVIPSVFSDFGITKKTNLVIDKDYHEISFMEDYDDLPMIVKLWLTVRKWEWIKDLAKKIGCTQKIYYSDFIEYSSEDDRLCALPLILADDENAVVLGSRWVKCSIFDFAEVREK